MVLQSRDDERELVNVLDVLLFATLIRDLDWHLWELDVDEQLVLFRSFLRKKSTNESSSA